MCAQGIGDQALAPHLQSQLTLAAAQHQGADGDLAGGLHRVADDGEGLGSDALFRHDVEGVVPVQPIDLVFVDEAVDTDGSGGLQLHLVEVVVIEQDILVLRHLIALDQIRALDGAGVRVGGHHPDAVVGVGIDQMETDVGGGRGRGVEGDRAGHQRQFQMSLPGGSCGHGRLLCWPNAAEPLAFPQAGSTGRLRERTSPRP